jgi:hypothetical protein
MNENKIITLILTIATNARAVRGSPAEMGTENWRKAIKDYEQILAELDRALVKKARNIGERGFDSTLLTFNDQNLGRGAETNFCSVHSARTIARCTPRPIW